MCQEEERKGKERERAMIKTFLKLSVASDCEETLFAIVIVHCEFQSTLSLSLLVKLAAKRRFSVYASVP